MTAIYRVRADRLGPVHIRASDAMEAERCFNRLFNRPRDARARVEYLDTARAELARLHGYYEARETA